MFRSGSEISEIKDRTSTGPDQDEKLKILGWTIRTELKSLKIIFDRPIGSVYPCSQDSYTADSPVHNMNEKELIMEAYMGYFIGAITVIFLSILIFGYVKTTEIPPCMCHNGTHPAYDEDICVGWFSN